MLSRMPWCRQKVWRIQFDVLLLIMRALTQIQGHTF